MNGTNENQRPAEGTVRPEKVAEAKRRIAIHFYDQEPVIEITVRRILKKIDKAA